MKNSEKEVERSPSRCERKRSLRRSGSGRESEERNRKDDSRGRKFVCLVQSEEMKEDVIDVEVCIIS